MYYFGRKSIENLATCHPDIQKVFEIVIQHIDCTIICGYRGPHAQDTAVREGKSKVMYPNSYHNRFPSEAVDAMPYHPDKPHLHWDDLEEITQFARFVQGVAAGLGIKLVWGGDFNQNWQVGDDKFIDGPHFRLEKDYERMDVDQGDR